MFSGNRFHWRNPQIASQFRWRAVPSTSSAGERQGSRNKHRFSFSPSFACSTKSHEQTKPSGYSRFFATRHRYIDRRRLNMYMRPDHIVVRPVEELNTKTTDVHRLFDIFVPYKFGLPVPLSNADDAAAAGDSTDAVKRHYVYSVYSFHRNQSDSWGQLAKRIQSKLASDHSKLNRTTNKSVKPPKRFRYLDSDSGAHISEPGAPAFQIALRNRVTNESISLEMDLESVFDNCEQLELTIDQDRRYRIFKSPAGVQKLELPELCMRDCPVVPKFDLMSVQNNRIPEHFKFHWYIEDKSVEHKQLPPLEGLEGEPDAGASSSYTLPGWSYRHTGLVYTPTEQDVGARLTVVVDCGPESIISMACTYNHTVLEAPNELLFETRQVHCRDRMAVDPTRLRLLSYNVLADVYINLSMEQKDLFFPYCDKQYQQAAYRYVILQKELPGYKSDILCLQEVDVRFHNRYLLRLMEHLNFTVLSQLKGNLVNEGCAIAFRNDKFRHLSSESIVLSEYLVHDMGNADILGFVTNQPEAVEELMLKRPTILQVEILESIYTIQGGQRVVLVVGNTHLHFHPAHGHIKLLQTLLVCRRLLQVQREWAQKYPDSRVCVALAGDFNSTPDYPVCQLLADGHLDTNVVADLLLSETSADQRHNTKLPVFSTVLSLMNASGAPPFTTYTKYQSDDTGEWRGFAGCLDYIWLSANDFTVDHVLTMPDIDLVTKHVALPSAAAPSDHLPIVVDVYMHS